MEVHIVAGAGGTGAGPVTFEKFAGDTFGIGDQLGMAVADGEIYVLDRTRLMKLVDNNKDGSSRCHGGGGDRMGI